MKRAFQSFLGVLSVTLAIGLAVSACGGSDTAAPTTPETATPETSPPETADTGAAAEGETGATDEQAAGSDTITPLGPVSSDPTELTVWSFTSLGGPEGSPGLQGLVSAFEGKYPNITVNLTNYDFSSLFGPRLRTAIAAKDGPDVVSMYGGGFVQSSGYEKALRPLYDLLSSEQREQLTLIQDWETTDPSLYALPYGAYAYVWYYNKDYFEQAGLDPESPPQTYDELLDACDKLSAAGITPISAGFRDGYLGGWYHYFGFASQLFSPDEKSQFATHEIDWTYPDMAASLTNIQELANRGCFGENSETRLLNEAEEGFRGGDAAMLYWTNLPGQPLEEQLGTGNVGVFTMPMLPDSEYSPNTMDAGANNGWAITTFQPDRCREAWEFVSFSLSPEGMQILAEEDGVLPNNNQVPATAQTATEEQIGEWLNNPDNHGGPSNALSSQETTLEVKLWPELVAGNLSPDEFVAQMQTARDKAPPLDEYALADPVGCE